jgi:hypothetical protein
LFRIAGVSAEIPADLLLDLERYLYNTMLGELSSESKKLLLFVRTC